MKDFETLVVEIEDAVARCARARRESLEITEATVEIPIEARLSSSGRMLASSPRGRMRTGFDAPHGRLSLHFVASDERGPSDEGETR